MTTQHDQSKTYQKYAAMAFSTNKTALARSMLKREAERTLTEWLEGRERAYAVDQLIAELNILFGLAAQQPIGLIRSAMGLHCDDPARVKLVTKALDLLGKVTGGDGL